MRHVSDTLARSNLGNVVGCALRAHSTTLQWRTALSQTLNSSLVGPVRDDAPDNPARPCIPLPPWPPHARATRRQRSRPSLASTTAVPTRSSFLVDSVAGRGEAEGGVCRSRRRGAGVQPHSWRAVGCNGGCGDLDTVGLDGTPPAGGTHLLSRRASRAVALWLGVRRLTPVPAPAFRLPGTAGWSHCSSLVTGLPGRLGALSSAVFAWGSGRRGRNTCSLALPCRDRPPVADSSGSYPVTSDGARPCHHVPLPAVAAGAVHLAVSTPPPAFCRL